MNLLEISFVFCLLFVGFGVQAQDASEITNSASEVCPLLIGEEVPDLTLLSHEGKEVNLKEVTEKQPSVLIFYRGGWCPYCNSHLKEIKDIEGDLTDLGYQIIAISADDIEHITKTMDKKDLPYLLLSDAKMTAAQAFGISFKVSDKTIKMYKTFGIDLDEASGESHHVLPVPAVFITGKKGLIQFNYTNPNYKVRLSGDVLLAAAKAAK